MSTVSMVFVLGLILTELFSGGGEAKGKIVSWKVTFLET
jgi:hypothetical protein